MAVRLLALDCSPRDGSNSGLLRRAPSSGSPRNTRARSSIGSSPCATCTSRPARLLQRLRQDQGRAVRALRHGRKGRRRSRCSKPWWRPTASWSPRPCTSACPPTCSRKFIMRTRVLRHQDFRLANRAVGVMAIAGRRSGGAETTIMATWLPFVRNGCLVVGNGDATSQFGAYGWAGARGHILTDEWGMEQGFQVAERVYTVAKRHARRQPGARLPQPHEVLVLFGHPALMGPARRPTTKGRWTRHERRRHDPRVHPRRGGRRAARADHRRRHVVVSETSSSTR